MQNLFFFSRLLDHKWLEEIVIGAEAVEGKRQRWKLYPGLIIGLWNSWGKCANRADQYWSRIRLLFPEMGGLCIAPSLAPIKFSEGRKWDGSAYWDFCVYCSVSSSRNKWSSLAIPHYTFYTYSTSPQLLNIHLCQVLLLHINLLQHLNAPLLLSTTMPIPTPPETSPSSPQIFLVASLPHLTQCTRISEITERCFHLFANLHFMILWHITKKLYFWPMFTGHIFGCKFLQLFSILSYHGLLYWPLFVIYYFFFISNSAEK